MTTISSENLTLVTIVTFLCVFFICAMTIPGGLQSQKYEGHIVNVPAYYEGLDIHNFAETKVINATGDYQAIEFKFGGWEMVFYEWTVKPGFSIRTEARWFIFHWDFDYFHWYDPKGIDRSEPMVPGGETIVLTYQALDDAYLTYGKDGLKWTLKNTKTQIVVFVGFNETKYSKPSEAIHHHELSLLLAINFDKVNTTFNAWNLIGAILFFQMPDVHPAINAIIAIPLWVLIAWLIYILILKAIPFVGG